MALPVVVEEEVVVDVGVAHHRLAVDLQVDHEHDEDEEGGEGAEGEARVRDQVLVGSLCD